MMDENEVIRALGRIEGKQDMMLDMMKEDRKRLASVEKKVWYGSGLAFALSVFAAKFGLPTGHA